MNKQIVYYSIAILIVLLCLLYARYLEMIAALLVLSVFYYIHSNFRKLLIGTFSHGFTRNYVFNSERDIITYESEGTYVSVCAVECFLHENGLDGPTLEKLVNSIDYQLKVMLKVQQVDVSRYVDWLKEERSKLEYKKSRLEDENKTLNYPEILQQERRISQLNAMLDRILKGDKPYSFRYVFVVEASGRDYIESVHQATTRASGVQKIADALFGGATKRLKGYDLYELL